MIPSMSNGRLASAFVYLSLIWFLMIVCGVGAFLAMVLLPSLYRTWEVLNETTLGRSWS